MSLKAENKKLVSSERLSLFDRPTVEGTSKEESTVYDWFTFKNIVIALTAITLVVFLGFALSIEVAFLTAAMMGLLAVILVELSSRRKWEHDLARQLRRMGDDYERLVRDVARNRNDTATLRKKLSDAAGHVVRSYDKVPAGDGIEQRMIKTIAEQFARLGEVAQEDFQPDFDPSIVFSAESIAKDVSLSFSGDNEIGKKLSDDQVLQIVNSAVQKDRIDLFLQPIVNLPQRKLRFYETFSRIRIMPDVYLPATRYIELAMEHDLMPVIDNLLLLRGLQVLRATGEADYNRAFFFNVTSLTLNDPKFMGDLVQFISQNRVMAPQLIFEMGQRDLAAMSADILPTLEGLSQLGCRFSMDQVKDLLFDVEYLESRRIRFIKVDAALLQAELKDDAGFSRLKRLKSALDRHGIDVIVEKIETDRQLLDLLDLEIDYGQGYLFGKPTVYGKSVE